MTPLISFKISAAVLINAALASATRTMTVYNHCPFTIWPAMFTSQGTLPSHATGWEAAPYSSTTFEAAEDWNGRVWGRRNCDFSSGSTLPGTCATGGCNGGLKCATSGGTGVPPATLAEFNFNGGGVDWYDISAVDGTDLPMAITNTVGCTQLKCMNDINSICPDELAIHDDNGYVIGCYTVCSKNANNNAANSPECCSVNYDTPETCPQSGFTYYNLLCASSVLSAAPALCAYSSFASPIWENRSAGSGTMNATGWEAAEYTSVTIDIAEDWNGRFWGRRDCDFSSGSTLPTTCLTGGCNGGLECATSGGTGVPPATLAEFNLGASGTDYYDVSGVDGTDLPVSITNTVGCTQPTCQFDINTICPSELSVYDTNGSVIGCNSACAANLDGDAADSPNCCSGSYDTPETCPSSGVEYYSTFKNACPDYYFYAYDDNSSLWTCASSLEAAYTVTFCP
ncbi:Thaumatin, pathogenesis-related protein [Pseudohyphozyma bogoriensis]|nr:Thaumatin, pathogenesis-related protein [Pseudohyphozyma bogoriensis]